MDPIYYCWLPILKPKLVTQKKPDRCLKKQKLSAWHAIVQTCVVEPRTTHGASNSQDDGKIRELTLPARMTVEGADCYIAAAIQGLGLIQIPHYRADEFIKTGTLVQVLEKFPPEPTPVSLLYPRNRQLSPRVRVFLEWASGQFSSRSGGAEGRG